MLQRHWVCLMVFGECCKPTPPEDTNLCCQLWLRVSGCCQWWWSNTRSDFHLPGDSDMPTQLNSAFAPPGEHTWSIHVGDTFLLVENSPFLPLSCFPSKFSSNWKVAFWHYFLVPEVIFFSLSISFLWFFLCALVALSTLVLVLNCFLFPLHPAQMPQVQHC